MFPNRAARLVETVTGSCKSVPRPGVSHPGIAKSTRASQITAIEQVSQMSPLLGALLRVNPKQWSAAVEAVASVATVTTRTARAQYRSYGYSVYANSPVFAEVWAEASRFAVLAASRPRRLASSSLVTQAWRALPPLPKLRAPSPLFILGHQTRNAVVASKLPNFSGAAVMLLVGGSNLMPATARCLEAKGNSYQPSLSAKYSGVLTPINTAETSWVDLWVPQGMRDWVEQCLTVLRAIHLSFLFSPVVALAPFLLYSGDYSAELWYKLLRQTLELGGAAFIKWGQWASTRYDVFPAKLCKELEELQAGAPEHTWAKTKEILERAYGVQQLESIFSWMDPTPIASGSIAQIHRAKLKEGVAESNGAGPAQNTHQRLLRSAQAGVELLASGEWRRVWYSVLEEWRQSAGKWEWNPGSFVGSKGGNGVDENGVKKVEGDTVDKSDKTVTSTVWFSGWRRQKKENQNKTENVSNKHPLERPEGDASEGRYVAVKVRHPGVVEALRRDFAILMWLATATKDVSFLQPFQLEHTVSQFGAHMLQQVDLTKEARNLTRFKDCFSLWPTVTFPTPVQGLATEEVLIETFESGVSISSFLMDPLSAAAVDDAIEALGAITGITSTTSSKSGNSPKTAQDKVNEASEKATAAAAYAEAARVPEENKILAALGVKTLLKMLIDDNFLHADLHPGNILVRLKNGGVVGGVIKGDDKESLLKDSKDGRLTGHTKATSHTTKPEIVILDTGLATELTPHQQASLAEFFQAIINWDGAGVAEKIISFSSNLSPNLDLNGFNMDIAAAVATFSESTPRAGDCMAAIFETVQHHHVTIDPNVMVAVVTVMVLEGWQFRLDPTINILDYIGDVLKSSFRKHQRLTLCDFALRDMWAPYSEPNNLALYRGSRNSPLSAAMEDGHHGL